MDEATGPVYCYFWLEYDKEGSKPQKNKWGNRRGYTADQVAAWDFTISDYSELFDPDNTGKLTNREFGVVRGVVYAGDIRMDIRILEYSISKYEDDKPPLFDSFACLVRIRQLKSDN